MGVSTFGAMSMKTPIFIPKFKTPTSLLKEAKVIRWLSLFSTETFVMLGIQPIVMFCHYEKIMSITICQSSCNLIILDIF